MNTSSADRVALLLDSVGIDYEDFQRFLIWALSEHLIAYLSDDKKQIIQLRSRRDGLNQCRRIVKERTNRSWSMPDVEALYQRVLQATETHYRKPITYENLLRLLFNSKHECASCHKRPPEVKLHIDHIIPVSKGGLSKYGNLQFLCQVHNLEKSNRLERTEQIWLNFE